VDLLGPLRRLTGPTWVLLFLAAAGALAWAFFTHPELWP
jgi:hypothetical protein